MNLLPLSPAFRAYRFSAMLLLLLAWAVPSRAEAAPASPRTEYDVMVFGGTPGGVAMAVRAAREGLDVLLVNHTNHLGGLLSNGLGVWDTLYEGKRSPVYDELRQAIFDHYRTTYGPDSPQYKAALPGKSGHTNGKFEPHVAEKLIDEMVARETRITVLRGYFPTASDREGPTVRSVVLKQIDGVAVLQVKAKVFADCSYEGDLMAVCGVKYRVGREARTEFDEPHAGMIFMRSRQPAPGSPEAQVRAAHDKLKLRKFSGSQVPLMPQSTGQGDKSVQAYNYRTVLSSDPQNRLPVEKPPGYDAEAMKQLEYGSVVEPLPNNKIGWNRPQLIGPQDDYPDGDWAKRREVMQKHWDATMSLLYFLQNDPTVDPQLRKHWLRYGLAKDEFVDNGHRPYEIYVREGRRLEGRYMFTEHDAMLAPGSSRAPVHADSIAVTEWYMDSHACTPPRIDGALQEGKMMLEDVTFPGQIPYASLLPKEIDNLLVPVCLSATHVAWGTVRLEPTWMNVGESAAYAAALALKLRRTPASIDPDMLLRTLAERRVMISFFNDVDLGAAGASWVPAVEYFGAKGFFATYDAKPDDPLTDAVAAEWSNRFAQLVGGTLDANAAFQGIGKVEGKAGPAMTTSEFVRQLQKSLTAVPAAKGFGAEFAATVKAIGLKPDEPISRAKACELMFESL